MDCDPLDRLYDRILEHYEWERRVPRRWLSSNPNEPVSRSAYIRCDGNAVGLLEIQTVAQDRLSKRQITWTRNARLPQDPKPLTDDLGSRMTTIATWDEALAAIDGLPST